MRHNPFATSYFAAAAMAAVFDARNWSRRKIKPWRVTTYGHHFDMPPSPNESRQVRRARERATK